MSNKLRIHLVNYKTNIFFKKNATPITRDCSDSPEVDEFNF